MNPESKLKEIWEGATDVEVQRVGEGETGLTHNQVLTARRLESIAEWWSIPEEQRNPRTILDLARSLGVSPASIRKWQRDPRMVRRVDQKTKDSLTYLMPNVIWAMYKRVMQYEDIQAAKVLLAGKQMGSSGINVTTQVNVSNGNMYQMEESDDRVLEAVNQAVERRVKARLAVGGGPGATTAPQGNQGKEAVEAVFSDSSNPTVPSVTGTD